MGLRIGIYGFGAIGRLVARYAIERGFELVGAVDIDPAIVGKDAGVLAGVGELGVKVSNDVMSLLDADVVVHATGSYLDRVYPQLLDLMEIRVDILSTCETLAYPWYRYPVLARKLEEKAVSMGVTVLGAGVNPGFLLDLLPVVLSSTVNRVRRILAVRSVDASKRRLPFRKKIGVGLSPEEAQEKLKRGEITGHVGYAESVMLIFEALGIQPTRVVEGQEILVADKRIEAHGVTVEPGQVYGMKGYGSGYYGNREVVRIEFHAYVGAEDKDKILIEGDEYNVTWQSTGTPGDQATAAVILSLAEAIAEAPPGLLTIVDLIPHSPALVKQ